MLSFRSVFALLVTLLLAAGFCLGGDGSDEKGVVRALIQEVTPMNVHSGDTVSATGVRLGSKFVLDLLLTKDSEDIRVEILSQSDKEITFKVPKDLKGRYRLMIMTNTVDPMLIEQPVRIMVE